MDGWRKEGGTEGWMGGWMDGEMNERDSELCAVKRRWWVCGVSLYNSFNCAVCLKI